MKELYEKMKSINKLESEDFLLYIWEIRTQIFAYDVDHIYGFYSSEYNVQLGLRDV